MKKFFYTTLFTLVFPAFVVGAYFLALPARHVEAQQTCGINQVGYRTHKPGSFVDPDFYVQGNGPVVYFDIQTSGCIGQTIKVSLVGELLDIDDNVNAFDELPILVGGSTNNEPNFTLAGRSGEEGCSITTNPDCHYKFVIENSAGVQIYNLPSNTLDYDCDGVCDGAGETWQYLDLIPFNNDLGGTGGLDQYGPGNTAGNVTTAPPPPVSDSPTGDSIIDLSIANPIAGTVDTIPEFFHMIINFVIKIAIPLVAMAIVYSGFLFVSARGSDEQLKTAKTVFTYAVIGGLLLLASWVVADAIKDALLSI